MLDLRQKLGVTIQHLIGSNMEPLLLGCANSTKVHPKVRTPLSNAKIAYSYTTCNVLAQWSCFCRCFSILWCADFVWTHVRMPGHEPLLGFFAFWRLLSRWSCHEALQAPSLTSSPSHNLGFARMMVRFSLEVSRTESKRLEEANVLPNSAITAIIAAAVPWLQTLKQRFCVTPGTEDFYAR